jgi:hypothetical protein
MGRMKAVATKRNFRESEFVRCIIYSDLKHSQLNCGDTRSARSTVDRGFKTPESSDAATAEASLAMQDEGGPMRLDD